MMRPFAHVGKQVLANGLHYADAVDERAASKIVEALNDRLNDQPPAHPLTYAERIV